LQIRAVVAGRFFIPVSLQKFAMRKRQILQISAPCGPLFPVTALRQWRDLP
jgi:hypothetical protein